MRALTVSFVTGFVLIAGAGSASAEEGLYAGGLLGFTGGAGEYAGTGFDIEFAGGALLGGFIGKDLGNQVRIEGELAFRQNDLANYAGVVPVVGEMTSQALMGNVYYDFGDSSETVFYLGIGMGAAVVTMDSTDFGVNDSDTTFALQLMAGGSFPVGEGLLMTIELRSFGAVPTFVDNVGAFEQGYGVGSLSLGLRQSF